jgi:hypothetical protein
MMSLPAMRPLSTLLVLLALSAGCTHGPASLPPVKEVKPRPEEVARAVLTRFLDAVEGEDWTAAWSLLQGPLRTRYTPERLHEDFNREPLAAERLRRARLVSQGPVRLTPTEALFPLGEDRAVRLSLEEGEYRIAAIE